MAQLVRVSSQYTMVMGSILSQGIYKNQPMNASISGTTNQSMSLSLFFSPFLSLSIIKKSVKKLIDPSGLVAF